LPFLRLCRRVTEAMQRNAAEKEITLRFGRNGYSGFVDCDPPKIERTLINIVQNAIKYTPEGGTIEVRVSPDEDDFLRLDVLDDGVGIPVEHLSRVTDRFYRIGEHVDGTGLGLAITKEIVERHGGRIELVSPVRGRERGTQVSVWLPVSPPARILVVTGESQVRADLRAQLKAVGIQAITLSTVDELTRHLQQDEADLILVCLPMPDMGGVQVISKVKTDQDWMDIPLLAFVDGELTGARREVMTAFSVPVIHGPYDAAVLVDRIESALAARQPAPQ
jgi:CheY-like chemotaxis protein